MLEKNACVTLSVLNPLHSDDFLQMLHYLYIMRSLSDFFLPFVSSYWRIVALLLKSLHFFLAFFLPSVLRSNHDWGGWFTTAGGSLQWQLSFGCAIELYRGVRQGSIRCAKPFAGEGLGGAILCIPEEPACSAVHLHICAPTNTALPFQAERFKYNSS